MLGGVPVGRGVPGVGVSGMERAIGAVEKAGGQVLHAYPPAVLVARVPADRIAKLVGSGGIVAATTEPFVAGAPEAAERTLGFAMAAWNNHFNLDRRMMMMEGPELEKAWDAPQRLPPDPPAEPVLAVRVESQEETPAQAKTDRPRPAPRRQVAFRCFKSAWDTWNALFQEAADFATRIGPERLISISHSEDNNEGVVVVWYWEDG